MTVGRGLLQFKVTLMEITPPVWRRIKVPATYTFWDLHVAVQDAMGWLDSHLHVFHIRNPTSRQIDDIGIPNDEGFEGDPVCLPGWSVAVAPYFEKVGTRATYEYDFGDGWVHEVELEAIGLRKRAARYPRCLDGQRACPPEDCGGPRGYTELLETIKNPGHDEYASIMEWLGGRFDPDAFAPERIRFDNPKTRWRIAFGDETHGRGA